MSDEMSIESYLEAGGILTSPSNVPARYRAELMRLMATFVDSELAGAAGFAQMINHGTGIKERISAAKIVMEKNQNADRILKIMAEFGANTMRYVDHHPWSARLERDADIGASRTETDMRLAVFNYPLQGWSDAVVMNLLMGRAVAIQLAEFSMLSYQPLAEQFRAIAPIEAQHTDLAQEGLASLLEGGAERAKIQAEVDYWWPRVSASFGAAKSSRAEMLKKFGLRKSSNAEQKIRWKSETAAILQGLGLKAG